jgi:hypothetical protein
MASCHVGHTGTHLITEVKQRWARVSTQRGNPREYAGCCWKVFPHLVTWVQVGRGIPHVKAYNSTPRLRYSKE